MFMVVLAAFSVFSYEITGRTDPAIRAFTTGRDEPTFQETMGLFLNVVPFQTDISRCASFREIVASTRNTCIDAYTHEVPITVIEQDLPDFNAPHDDPKRSQLILGMYQATPGDEAALPIADGAYQILDRTLPSTETSDIPSGMVWNMTAGTGGVTGSVVYNLDEFDEPKVTGWVSGYHRILSRLVSEPDREWRQLAAVAS
jgi:non-ribosomal peptide synthetase component F